MYTEGRFLKKQMSKNEQENVIAIQTTLKDTQ